MITLITKHFKSPARVRKPSGGTQEVRQTNIAKWRRKDGHASFLQDLVSLRKTLALCYHCANVRMPRKWQQVYNYEELTAFHGVNACDYCREEKSIALYLAGDEPYWQEYEKSMRHEAQVRKRERDLYNKDRRYFVGY